MVVRCQTRSDLEAYGVAIFILSAILFFFFFGAVMAARDGEAQAIEDFAFLAIFGTGYLVLLTWVGLRIREWRALGDATLSFSPNRPRVGDPFNCRMQFERPPAEQGPVRAELICQKTTRTGSGKNEKSSTQTLWRDLQVAPTSSLLHFTFNPPENLPAVEDAMRTEVRWWLRVRTGGLDGFRRRFRMPIGPKTALVQDGMLDLMKTELATAGPGELPKAFKAIYTLCAIAVLANVGVIALGVADKLRLGEPSSPQFEGKLRLGDLRQTSTSDFAAQLDGTFAWKRGSLDVRAESLRLRAWDCEGVCPKIQEISLVLWHFGEDEQGGVGGTGVARSEPITVDKVPQDGSVLDLGAKSFDLRVAKNPDPRLTSLMLEVKTDKREYEYGQRFGGAARLFGLVQVPGEGERCAKVKSPQEALEHFCHVQFSELISGATAAQKQRLLSLAVGRGNLEAVKALLAAEVKVDPVNSYGYTPLMVAVFADQPEIAAALIDAGANPNFAAKPDSEYGSDSPLGAALTAGALRSAQVLIDKGADLKGMHSRSTVVHVAVAADLPEFIAPLVKKGADVNARAGWGNQPTPLMAAAGIGNLQAVNQLLDLGADAAAGDSNGNTARDYAATHKRRDVLERLKAFPGKCAPTGC
jgi:ankyrin repeat protein